MKKHFLILISLIVLCIPAVKSLFYPGAYTSHDLTHHIVRQIDMDKLLSEGQFPPRWSGDLNNGYGYPLFLFNYPGPAFLGEFFHKIGFSFTDSVKAVMFVSVFASIAGMYLFLNALLPKQKMAPFLGTVFYVYAPVRFINLYVSGSVGASLAMGIIPFVFWSVFEVYKGKPWAIPAGSVFLSFLIISHNVTAMIFSPVLVIFSLVLILGSENKKQLFGKIFLMAFLGLGLSAFFWIPSIIEKKYIVYDSVMKDVWVNQFPTVKQLIHSPWGYGLAHPGVNEPGGMSFQIGLAHILVIALLAMSMVLFRKKRKLAVWGWFSLAVFFLSIFLMLQISSVIWKTVPFLYLVQYPYRFLALSVFSASIAAALTIYFLPVRFKNISFVFLLVLVIYANRNHLNINQSFNPGDEYFASRINDATSYNEHLPIWAGSTKQKSAEKLSIISGGGNIKITENKSARVAAEINLNEDSVVRFNQLYFPGWVLEDNGQPIRFDYTGDGENKGLPVFGLAKGSHDFSATFTETPDRKVADVLSLISLATVVGLAVYNSTAVKKRKSKNKNIFRKSEL